MGTSGVVANPHRISSPNIHLLVVLNALVYHSCWIICRITTVHPGPFYVTAPNITSSILSPNLRERIYSFKNSLPSSFIPPKCNANVKIEGSCDMQRFLFFVAHFTNFLHVNVVSVLLLMPTYQRLEVQQLLEYHFFSLYCHIYMKLCIVTKFNNLH
jgi:hypothetical protein